MNFSVLASGRIKWFQIVTSIVYMLDLVILYLLFVLGLPPATALWVKIGIMVVVLFVRLYFAHKEIPCIDFKNYMSQVLLPLMFMSVGSILFALLLMPFFYNLTCRLLLTAVIIIFNIVLIWFVALTKQQRQAFLNIINRKRKIHA